MLLCCELCVFIASCVCRTPSAHMHIRWLVFASLDKRQIEASFLPSPPLPLHMPSLAPTRATYFEKRRGQRAGQRLLVLITAASSPEPRAKVEKPPSFCLYHAPHHKSTDQALTHLHALDTGQDAGRCLGVLLSPWQEKQSCLFRLVAPPIISRSLPQPPTATLSRGNAPTDSHGTNTSSAKAFVLS